MNMTREKLINHIRAQARSADMWVAQWQRYKDMSGVRNAALAIGKIHGMYGVLLTMNGADFNMPEDVQELMKKYNDVWDNLDIESPT